MNAEFEEVEYYTSLEQMTRAADVVVVGRVIDAGPTGGEPPTDPSPSCEGYTVTLAIELVLSGQMTPPNAPAVTVEWSFGTCDLPQIHALQLGARGMLFLRNKGVELRAIQPSVTAAEIAEASRHWRTVVDVPDALNAPFLAELEGSSFEGLAAQVAAIGSSTPDTSTGTGGQPVDAAPFWIVLLGCLTALAVLVWPHRRLRA